MCTHTRVHTLAVQLHFEKILAERWGEGGRNGNPLLWMVNHPTSIPGCKAGQPRSQGESYWGGKTWLKKMNRRQGERVAKKLRQCRDKVKHLNGCFNSNGEISWESDERKATTKNKKEINKTFFLKREENSYEEAGFIRKQMCVSNLEEGVCTPCLKGILSEKMEEEEKLVASTLSWQEVCATN